MRYVFFIYLTGNSLSIKQNYTQQIRILHKELEFWLIFISDDFARIRIIPVCKLKKKGYYVFSIALSPSLIVPLFYIQVVLSLALQEPNWNTWLAQYKKDILVNKNFSILALFFF